MTMMNFAHPWVLWLVPAYVLAEAVSYLYTRRTLMELPTAGFARAPQTWRIRAVRVSRFFPVVTIALLLIAVSGPRRTELQRTILPSGIDVMIALDVSGSMAAEDFQPLNRLAVAKDVLNDFVVGRPSDRIGLILFAGRSVTRSPLTLQHAPLLKTLREVDLGKLPEGTAIGLAIMSGVSRLRSYSPPTARGDRILVLITDGRNNTGEVHPLDALKIALEQKIRIYTIGVGSFGRVPFPYTTPEGKKEYRYEEVDLDEPLLKQIAEKTGGRYFRATDPESLGQLFAQINQLEKSEPQVVESRVLENDEAKVGWLASVFALCYLALLTAIRRTP